LRLLNVAHQYMGDPVQTHTRYIESTVGVQKT